jgi:4-hydroxythreonine-4-phosphate dehydrogenase
LALRDPKTTALVTGPLSKTLIKSAGYKAIGHTEILSQVSNVKNLYMGFVGKFFNVILMTGHIPLQSVSNELKKLDWENVLLIAHRFSKGLPLAKKPMALVALNPHAGEKGMISAGEDDFLKAKMKILAENQIQGPLVPDAAFLKANWKRYSVYLCCYHDQGLIPFKAIHGQDSGVHVTLGLPFVRTSVDHGTAKEIYGQNKANPNSMKEALALAKRLLS